MLHQRRFPGQGLVFRLPGRLRLFFGFRFVRFGFVRFIPQFSF